MTFAPGPPAVDKSKSEQPHFEIQVEDGRGFLLLRPRTFFGWLRVDSLQLAIPEVTFPLDITGGMAQFQRQRCPVIEARFSVERAGLVELVQRRARLLEAAGFEEVGVGIDGGAIELVARARLREWAAELSVRVAVEGDERTLRLRVADAATFGYIRRPAQLLAHDLLCVLTNASTAAGEAAAAESAVARGLGVVQLRPLDWFAVGVLAPAGWRLPELDGVRLARPAPAADGIALCWTRDEAAASAAAGARPAGLDELAARSIDEALLRNDLGGAAGACRVEMTRRPERAAALTERLLGILCTRDGSLREAEQLAREALGRWPDLGAAHLALAAVHTAAGRTLEAARHFGEAARLAEARHDTTRAVRAAAAAARALQATDPARAVALYERVLVHRPADREATEALADLYAAAGRWAELRALLQGRLAAARDQGERLEAHLRVAELSFTRLRDPAAARVDLQAAAALAPGDRRVWELMAQVCDAAGDVAECIGALERLAAVLAETGDHLAEARARLRIADHYEALGDDPGALRSYRQALALQPEDSGALERFAAVAARHGDAADAISAYRRLLERGGGPSDRRRRAAQQLLQLLVIIGDREEARALLPTLAEEPAPDVLMGLGRLEEACDDLAAAADLWARAAAQLDGQHAAAAELERARICRAAGAHDEERAALGRALALAPTGQEGLTAAAGLIRLAREAADVAAEAAWLDRLLACEPSPPSYAELALRRAQLYLDGGDAAGAARALDRLQAAGHDGPAVRRLWADVRGALGDARGRAEALEALAGELDGAERARHLVLAAQSRLEGDEIEAAAADVRAAEALLPDDVALRATAAEIAWRRRAWEDVIVHYGELCAEASGEVRVEWGRRVAVAADHLGRTREALGALEQALAAPDAGGAALVRAWRELAQLCERLGDSAAAVDCYRRGGADARLAALPAARVELWRGAAELLQRRLGRHEEAVAALTEALAIAPGDLDTLDALDALQSELGDGAGLMATLGHKLALPDAAPERRREWLERLGELAAARGDVARARAAFDELLLLAPTHAGALRWLCADAAAQGDETRADLCDARLAVAPEVAPEEQRAARLRLAERAQRAGRMSDAETHLWAAVELTPAPEQPPLYAALERVYAAAERWADLVVVLNHHALGVGDAEERLALDLRRIGLLTRELGTPKVAVASALEVIERHGRAPALVAALADAARAAGDEPVLAEALATQAEMTVDAAERGRLLAEAAARLVSLGDHARAAALARELGAAELGAAELGAVELGAAERLVLYEAAGMHDEAARLLGQLLVEAVAAGGDTGPWIERLRAAARGPAGLAALADGLVLAAAGCGDADDAVGWLREAAAARTRLDDFSGAAEALVAACARRPDDEGLLAEVETLLGDLGDGTRLRAVLEGHLATRQGEARLPTLRKLLRLAEELGDEAAAQRFAAEARRLEPAAAARVNVQALVRTVAPGMADGAALRAEIRAAETALAALPADDVTAVRAARQRLAVLYKAAKRHAEAYEQLALVLSEEPSNVEVLRRLCDVAEAVGRWAEAAQLLERLSHLLTAPAERAALLYRAGELHLVRLGDREAASAAYLQAIDLDAAHAPTLRRLVDYFWSAGDDASAAEMAAALGADGLGAAATAVGTRARAALALALAGDAPKAALLGGALDEGAGAAALAAAALELLARADEAAVARHLRAVTGAGPRLAAVRRQLLERGGEDPRAAGLAARLGSQGSP